MNKKYLAIIAATLVFATAFAACTKKYEEERILTDKENNEHILATDEQGNTMQNEDGHIIEVVTDSKGKEVTDENGKQVTQAVTYPDVLEANGYVEDQYVKVKPEAGWEQNGEMFIQLDLEKYGAEYTVDVRENVSVEDIAKEFEVMAEGMKKTAAYKEADFKKEEVKINGIKMTKLTITYALNKEYIQEGDPESQIMYVYLHTKETETYCFTCAVLPQYKDKVDFDKIIAAVEYK